MRKLLLALVLGICVVTCDDDPVGPPGSVRVRITTIGVDPDPDFLIRVAGQTYAAAGLDTVRIDGVRPGRRQLRLEALASNCSVTGGPVRSVSVRSGETVDAEFVMTCSALTGAIAVTARISGGGRDPNGLTVRLGTGSPRAVGSSDSLVFESLAAGDHSLTLGDIASNCALTGTNPRVARVNVGGLTRDTARVVFLLACEPLRGSAGITVSTTGSNPDPDGYTVSINEAPGVALPPNGTVTVPGLIEGPTTFQLDGVAPNCVVAEHNPRSISIIPDFTIRVDFEVSCFVATNIAVTVQTTGVDADQNGYRVQVIDPVWGSEKPLGANATVAFGVMPAGSYTVALLDLAPNCEVTGPATRNVVTTTGTLQVNFAVTCAPLRMIAFSREVDNANWEIHVSREDGSGVVRLTTALGTDNEPAWSSTGRIAFRSGRDTQSEIYVMNADGSGQTRLTNHPAPDYAPAWSPDGTRIAFVSERDGNAEIYIMNADGSNPVRITNSVEGDFDPTWSPDGAKIAFTRGYCGYVSCTGEIHVVNTNGQGLVKITDSGGISGQPAWSPDGAKIAFARLEDYCGFYYYVCKRDIAVMSPTGVGVAILPGSADEGDPAWSPTGTRLLISVGTCGYYQCFPSGLRIIRADGADPIQIISGAVTNAVWRP